MLNSCLPLYITWILTPVLFVSINIIKFVTFLSFGKFRFNYIFRSTRFLIYATIWFYKRCRNGKDHIYRCYTYNLRMMFNTKMNGISYGILFILQEWSSIQISSILKESWSIVNIQILSHRFNIVLSLFILLLILYTNVSWSVG